MTDRHPLHEILERLDVAVPAWLKKVDTWGLQQALEEAVACADTIAHYADRLWVTDKKPPEDGVTPDKVFEAIACGVAILMKRHGGVQIANRHWCIDPDHEECPPYWVFDFKAVDMNMVRTGAHFTPQKLAQEITEETLAALTHRPGPLESADVSTWKPAPFQEWFPIRVADIAVGSGSFLVAAFRHIIAAIGCPNVDLDMGVRVVEECLYGADINPWSVDMARMSLSLMVPFCAVPALDRHVVCGDALAGALSPLDVPEVLDTKFPDRTLIHWRSRFPEVFNV